MTAWVGTLGNDTHDSTTENIQYGLDGDDGMSYSGLLTQALYGGEGNDNIVAAGLGGAAFGENGADILSTGVFPFVDLYGGAGDDYITDYGGTAYGDDCHRRADGGRTNGPHQSRLSRPRFRCERGGAGPRCRFLPALGVLAPPESLPPLLKEK